MIKKPSTSLLLPAELVDTIKDYINAVEESNLNEPFITRITDLLMLDLEILDEALTAVHRDKLVDVVAHADAVRDDLFIGFCDLIEAHGRLHGPAIEAAYEEVWPVIEQAGTTLHALSYEAQSSKMEALFVILDTPPKQMALSALNALAIYEEMKASQKSFTETYNNKLKLDDRKNYPTLRDAKSRTVPHVNALLNAIEILVETGEDSIESLVMAINQITDEAMSLVKARATK